MGDDIMHTARLIPRWFLVILTMIFVILPASAREKTDEVILKNGDHLTCWIQTLARGMLTVKTDPMGTIEIKWQDVQKITSRYLFRVEDNYGNLYVGSLWPGIDKEHMDIAGMLPVSNLSYLSIVEIMEVGGSRWQRFSGAADLGYSFTKASDRTQFNFTGDIEYRTERYSGQLNYSSTLGTSKGETDADRKLTSIVGIRQFSGKWIAYSQVRFEHNLELELDRRYSFLGGPGYKIAQSNRALITAIGAASFSRESYYGESSMKNAEGFFGVDVQFFKLYSPKFDIVNQLLFIPNFTTRGRRRLEFNSKLRFEILRDFFVTMTLYDSFDSKPPSETAVKNDYGFTTGLSWTFGR
jgi:hypothetical protein